MSHRARVSILVIALTVLCLLSFAGTAQAYVYWTNALTGSIGRANNDGTGANQYFITGCSYPEAIDIQDGYLYWVNGGNGGGVTIGKAKCDGSNVNQNFVTGLGGQTYGLAVNGSHVFWLQYSPAIVGRAGTDGNNVNHSFLNTGRTWGHGLASYGDYIYWTGSYYPGGYNHDRYSIDRARTDGSDMKHNVVQIDGTVTTSTGPITVPGVDFMGGIWAGPSYLFWTTVDYDNGQPSIGRANTPYGYFADRTFIKGTTGAGAGIAKDKDDDYIYWCDDGRYVRPGAIGRVKNDGSHLSPTLITATNRPFGVCVDLRTGVATVQDLGAAVKDSVDLPQGLRTSLVSKLRNAKMLYQLGHTTACRNVIGATINAIEAHSGKAIPAETAQEWITVLELVEGHIL